MLYRDFNGQLCYVRALGQAWVKRKAESTGNATVILGTDGSISLSSAPVAGTTVYLDGVEWSV